MACQTATETKTNANTPPATKESPATATAKVEPAKPSGGSLATPTDTYKTAYAARKNKDIAGLKRVFSQELLKFLTEIAEADKKTLDDSLKELSENPQAPTDEVRGEKITGNQATLEYQDEKGKWKTMDFVKEGNDWKMTLPSAPPGGAK
jgi:hypothetical protein